VSLLVDIKNVSSEWVCYDNFRDWFLILLAWLLGRFTLWSFVILTLLCGQICSIYVHNGKLFECIHWGYHSSPNISASSWYVQQLEKPVLARYSRGIIIKRSWVNVRHYDWWFLTNGNIYHRPSSGRWSSCFEAEVSVIKYSLAKTVGPQLLGFCNLLKQGSILA